VKFFKKYEKNKIYSFVWIIGPCQIFPEYLVKYSFQDIFLINGESSKDKKILHFATFLTN